MRPRDLTIQGFRSYADDVTFEWGDRSLVGIVGPIGSGKSSILDAIAFALYGKTPRIERDTKSLINQRRDAMHVALTFEVDGQVWKAVRVLRRSGASSHVLYRIEDGQDVEVTDKSREMGEQIESLLGLDFDAFRRSVLLAQNQFATFLDATGTERNQVLKGVFGFERLDAMRAVTKERLDAIDRSLATLAGRRSSADADSEDVAAKRTALTAAEDREATLEKLRVPFEEAKGVIASSADKVATAGQRLDRLGALADRIPGRERVDEILTEADRGRQTVDTALAEVERAVAARREAAVARDTALEAAGGRAGLDDTAAIVHRWSTARGRLDDAAARLETLRQAEAATHRRVDDLEAAVNAAVERERATLTSERAALEAVEQARTALDAANQEHRAHALRAELVAGEPCPVCAQRVGVVPESGVPASIDEAERGLEVAQQAAKDATAAARSAAETAGQARSESAAANEARSAAEAAANEAVALVEAARQELDTLAGAVAERLGPGDPEELLAERRSGVDGAEQQVAIAAAAEEQARSDAARAQEGIAAALGRVERLRTEVATVAGTLDLSLDVGDSSAQLTAALVALREAWIGKQQAAEGDRARAQEEREAAQAALAEMLTAAGLGEGDDVVEVIAAARAERSGIEAEVQLLEKRLEDLKRLADDEAELVASAETLRMLHADLAPSKFLEFVLDERRRALGDLASEHLEVLTGGRYRFDESGDFLLVDLTAADSVRSSTSLSGGETFLASLGLALALAEIVAREGGRLDAFFLDEGFGSLDPEHLDLAMDGVERLVTSADRLVVVVSHVPALRERIEDLVVLDRDPVTGNTTVVSGRTAR